MFKRSVTLWSCVVLSLGVGSAALGQTYDRLLDIADLHIGDQYQYVYAHVFDGTTAYCVLRDVENVISTAWESQIVRIDDVTGTRTKTLLVSNSQWAAFAGINPEYPVGDGLMAGNHMAVLGSDLQFLDYKTNAIYRVHKVTGVPSVFVSNAAIRAVTGLAQARLLGACDFSPCGDMAFYDQDSDSILAVDASGNLSFLVTSAQLQSLYTCPSPPLPSNFNFVSGGMAYDREGNLYWAQSNGGTTCGGGAIYKRAVDGTLSRVLSEAQIQTKTGVGWTVAFNDILAAPDGKIYFFDRNINVRSLLYFDPADPVNTLAFFVTQADLLAGTSSVYVSAFAPFGNKLTWHDLSPAGYGIYEKALVAPALARPDFNGDADVDLADFSHFQSCFNGPNRPAAAAGCCDADLDADGDVDLADFGVFQGCFNGPDRPPACR